MEHIAPSSPFLSRRSALKAIAAVSFAAGPSLHAASAPTPDLSEIIRRNTLARGGAAALDRVRSVAIEVEIAEGGHNLNGRYAANEDGLVRIDVYAAGRLIASEGIDKDGVWILGRDGPEPSIATGAANALKHGADNHLFGWHRFAERGHKLKLMPSAPVDGLLNLVVEIRYSTGHVSYFFVNPANWQAVRRRDERAYHPDVDQTRKRVETRMSDFQSVEGVIAAHRSDDYDLATGDLLASNRVLSRRINPQLSGYYFDRERRAPRTM